MSTPPADAHAAALQSLIEVAKVRGQLDTIMQLLASNHGATQQRISDLQVSSNQRFDALDDRFVAVDKRIETLERHERGTALKTAGLSAMAGSIGGLVGAGFAMLRITKGG